MEVVANAVAQVCLPTSGMRTRGFRHAQYSYRSSLTGGASAQRSQKGRHYSGRISRGLKMPATRLSGHFFWTKFLEP